MSFHDRLKQARLSAGLTQREVSNMIGVAVSTYSGYETGKSEPSMNNIANLMRLFEITADWLFQDAMDEQFKNEYPEHFNPSLLLTTDGEDENELLNLYRSLIASAKAMVLTTIRAFAGNPSMKKDAPRSSDCFTEMIIYNFPAAAGIPLYVEDDSYERLEFPAEKVPQGADFGIRISGDSMEPTIPAGSIVFVRKTSELRPGEIGIFMLDDEAVCKRFSMNKRGVVLLSDNPAYPEIAIKDYQRFAITGKVLGYK